jgi:hypothetical protein
MSHFDDAKSRALQLWSVRKSQIATRFGPALESAQLSGLQTRLGFALPSDLVEWLRVCNGAETRTWAHTFLSVGDSAWHGYDIESTLNIFESWRARRWIPFAGDGFGDYFLLVPAADRSHPVVTFWDHERDLEDSHGYVVSSTLWHFLANVFDPALEGDADSLWPFNADYTIGVDPDLLNLRQFPMPWDP